MIQNSPVPPAGSGPTIEFLRILAPFVGGSIATLLGTAFQRRLTKRDERIRELYEPLYRRINPFSTGELQFNDDSVRVQSVWNGIEHHQRRAMSEDLQGDVAEIEEMVEYLNLFFIHLKDAIAENCTYTNVLMSSSGIHPSIAYKKRGGHTTGYSLNFWIRQYYGAVLSADDESELADRLLKEANRKGKYQRQAIESWDDSDFRSLGEAIVEAEDRLQEQSDFDGASDLYEVLQSKSEMTVARIDERVNKSGFRRYVSLLTE